ncbi:MAG: hypothetical protein JNM68_17050, partial [Dinghuibacter sp.]|nr:hypothetical protein [Dinghuibacter sp.]
MNIKLPAYILVLLIISCKGKDQQATTTASLKDNPDVVSSKILPADSLRTFPFVQERVNRIEAALRSGTPVLPLTDSINEMQQKAQQLALRDGRFLFYSKDSVSGKPLRNEVFGIYPVRESDFAGRKYDWKGGNCFRVEMYNYALNLSSVAVTDVAKQTVVWVN